MILKFIGILIVVVILAIIVNTINIIRSKNNVEISFKEFLDLTDLPIISFYIGNQKLNFLLDTGSNNSIINESIIETLPHTKKEDTVVTFGMEGNKVINSYGELKLYYKNKEFVDDFTIMNLDNAFDQIKQESGVQIHGILGNRFFEKYGYVLNFNTLTACIK